MHTILLFCGTDLFKRRHILLIGMNQAPIIFLLHKLFIRLCPKKSPLNRTRISLEKASLEDFLYISVLLSIYAMQIFFFLENPLDFDPGKYTLSCNDQAKVIVKGWPHTASESLLSERGHCKSQCERVPGEYQSLSPLSPSLQHTWDT